MPDLTSPVSLSHHAPAVDTPISVRATGAGASRPVAGRRVGIGGIVAGSLAAGLAAAVLLIIAPLVSATDTAVTGAVLCGFGLGWAMVAVLSMRFTDQPQRWAAAPALLMALSGVLLLGAPAVDPVLDWVWPPAALAVAIVMAVGRIGNSVVGAGAGCSTRWSRCWHWHRSAAAMTLSRKRWMPGTRCSVN